jgi:G3E family GTPase
MLRFRLDGVVTLVDAVNGEATLDVHQEAVKQAAVADRLVLTKTDLQTDEAAVALRKRLAGLNPSALLLDAARGEAGAAALLNAGLFDPERKSADVRKWLNAEAFPDAAPQGAHHHEHHDHEHHGHGHDNHKHDVNRHDASIRAFCLREATPLAPAAFDLFLELLRNAHGPCLLRVKGIVALADDPLRPIVIHGVQHVFHPPVRLDAWPDEDRSTRIVFILRDMEPSFVEGLWKAFADVPLPGRADGVALASNPLAPKSGGLLA